MYLAKTEEGLVEHILPNRVASGSEQGSHSTWLAPFAKTAEGGSPRFKIKYVICITFGNKS